MRQQKDPKRAEVPQMQPLAQEAQGQWRAMLPITTFLQELTALPSEFFLRRCLKLCPRRGCRQEQRISRAGLHMETSSP